MVISLAIWILAFFGLSYLAWWLCEKFGAPRFVFWIVGLILLLILLVRISDMAGIRLP